MIKNIWGWSYSLNLGRCNPALIRSSVNIYNFNNELVKKIKMTPYGEPSIIHFGEGNKKGYTLVQLITTSNITAHFSEDTDSAFLDVFSCKEFNKDIVKEVVDKYFEPKEKEEFFFERNIPNTELK